jgi:protein-tyrosine-phosphatase
LDHLDHAGSLNQHRVDERALGMPSTLLAHHVTLPEQAGVVERSRSQGDHGALADLVPRRGVRAPRVVFVCTGTSARSQLAAALWGRHSTVPVASAGTAPARGVHPLAVATARAHGLSLAHARTAHVDEVLRPDDLVVAVCDNAHERLDVDRLHWSVPDPAPLGTAEAFGRVFTDPADRVDRLAPAVHASGGTDA